MLHLTYQSILSAFSISIPSIQQYSDINQLFRPQHKPFYKISPTLSSCSNNLMFCPCLGLLCSKQFFCVFDTSTVKKMPGEQNSQVLAALKQDSCLYTLKTAL